MFGLKKRFIAPMIWTRIETFDKDARTLTLNAEGVNSDGDKTLFTGVTTIKGDDTITWKRIRGEGAFVEGESPTYTFERVKRARQSRRLKQAQ